MTGNRIDRSMLGSLTVSFLNQTSLVVSGVIIARSLGPLDRGYMAGFVVVATVSVVLITLGLPTALTYAIASTNRKVGNLLRDLRRLFAFQLFLLVIIPGAILYSIYRDNDALAPALISIPIAGAYAFTRYGLAVLQGQHRFGEFNRLRMMPEMLAAGGAITCLAIGSTSLNSFVTAYTITSCFSALVVVRAATKGQFTADRDREAVSDIVKFGAKAELGATSPLDDLKLDQVAMGMLVGPAGLGSYVVASAFTNLPRFIAQSLGMIAYPRVAAAQDRDVRKKIATDALVVTVSLCAVVALALIALMGVLVPLFFGNEFAESVAPARILVGAAFLFATRRILSDVLRGSGLPLHGSVAEVASWIAFGSAVIPLTDEYGIMGTATAVLIAASASLTVISGLALRDWRRPQRPRTASE